MIARQLISPTFPSLICTDKGQKALNIMDSFRVNHIPLVRDKEYIGLISDHEIYDFDLMQCCFGERSLSLISPYIIENQHIFEAIQIMLELKLTVLPVLDLNHEYLGVILISELANSFLNLAGAGEPGAVIILELSPNNYSLSQIAQIVEANDAKILSLYTKNQEDSMELDVTLKVNVTDASSIIETFVRYDYSIKAVYMDNSKRNNMFTERYEQFMRFINI
ncbi:MAG TPA: CBS domain-containing protein [Prolixibacteraceae bacterium]|nr:CBS domain-containing protein [Prolixibacteraceae bacterium]